MVVRLLLVSLLATLMASSAATQNAERLAAASPTDQSGTAWRDPSPHQVRFVTVDSSVRLEVLDWEGSGSAARSAWMLRFRAFV